MLPSLSQSSRQSGKEDVYEMELNHPLGLGTLTVFINLGFYVGYVE